MTLKVSSYIGLPAPMRDWDGNFLCYKRARGQNAKRGLDVTRLNVAFHHHRHHRGQVSSNGNKAEPEIRRKSKASSSNHEEILSRKMVVKRIDSQVYLNQYERVGVGGSGVSSHPWERKASSQSRTGHGFAPLTSGRS
ncbi:hypothetical protein TIFTF001_032031 [Ficus carica]|uniref:Uncharacterized protein n=1 Tax=Ficus carica TaxID=3494 RepID=A0AA88DXN7_FICCA|nr:hypothetical protein TIFTF001_031989 [Ficus carica]GMN62950.1 hypothetical protein TIFTF001_032031 [Ficus carica]